MVNHPVSERTDQVPGFGGTPGFAPMGYEEPLISRYLRIVLRWKWVILGALAGALLIGLAATFLMTRLYTANTTIEISRESNKVVQIQGVEQESSASDLEFYQTQYGLLRSRALAEQVAVKLKLVDDVGFFAMFGEPIGADSIGAGRTLTMSVADRPARQRIAGKLLLENVEIFPIRLSRLVDISVTSADPSLSMRIANAWSENFIESNLARRFEATSYARDFLEKRLAQLRIRLDESERALVGYASRESIINLPVANVPGAAAAERSLETDDLASLNTELGTATGDRIKAESRWKQLSGDGAVPEALTNTAIATLRQRRGEVAGEYAKLLTQFEPQYPSARALAAEISRLDQSIGREESRVRDSIRNAYRESYSREQALQARVSDLKGKFLDLRRRSIQYNIFQRDVDTNRQLYDGLLQRYKEIGVAGGVGTNNVSIVDRAVVPQKPSSPRLMLNLAIALLAGTILGIAAAFVLEQMDEAISGPEEVQRILSLPLLGAIPMADGDIVDNLRDRKSSLVEAYLSVQTNLEFSTDHGVPRSIGVTSTRPAEGKSTTSLAIAIQLARARKRVLLVDGDMRSPSVHGLLALNNPYGISNYLAGTDDVSSLIQQAPEFGLSVISAGPMPPNAAELLTGGRLQQFLVQMAEHFDHVVIDSPPVMGLADAPLIASRVEGMIFVVESHGIRASLVRVAMGRLASANARILGSVLTKFETKRAQYGYGYDYGYGYGREAKDGDKSG